MSDQTSQPDSLNTPRPLPTPQNETAALLLATVLDNPWIKQTPTQRQAEFLGLTCREAFTGGSAGGGKSSALLMAALQYVDVPGYAALILRRSFSDLALPGAIMDRAHDWLQGTAAHWSDRDKTWSFPSGATLTFGYLENDNDRYRYQGMEITCCCFDELTQFSEVSYRYLFSRLRHLVGLDVPLRMRSASNPGGIGHAWVKQRFIVEGDAPGRQFVPSKFIDNPFLSGDYVQSLNELDPVTRAQLRDGDWDIKPAGRMFNHTWFQVIAAAPPCSTYVRFWDMAATAKTETNDPDWTVGLKLGLVSGQDGQYCIVDVRRIRGTPAQTQALIRQTATLDGKDVPIFMEQECGSAGPTVIDHYASSAGR